MQSAGNPSRSAKRRERRRKREEERRETAAKAAISRARAKRWLADHGPALRFCVKFCGLLIAFYFAYYSPACRRAVDASTVYYARMAGAILAGLGETIHRTGATLSSPKFSETVLPSCAAFEFPLFFTAMAISFPARIAAKVIGILVATVSMISLNLVRVTSLFLIGAHLPGIFAVAHQRLWGTILISAMVVLSILWIKWAAPPEPYDAAAA